jgi:hypothetical protein
MASGPIMRQWRLRQFTSTSTLLNRYWPAQQQQKHQQAALRCLFVACATPEVISSTANSLVKHCVKLRTSAKYRKEQRQFMLSGLDLLQEAAGGGVLRVRIAFLPQSSRLDVDWLDAERVVKASDAVLKKLTGLDNVDGIAAVAQLDMPPPVPLCRVAAAGVPNSDGNPIHQATWRRLLALESVQDPGNLGTLMRRYATPVLLDLQARSEISAGQRVTSDLLPCYSAHVPTRFIHHTTVRWRLGGMRCACCLAAATPTMTRQ